MVACAAEAGFAETRIADVAATAGVSSKTFYRHFPDKETCLVATVDAALERLGLTSEAVAAHPAAARLCLLEVPAAGAKGLERFDRLLVDLEERAREASPASLPAGEAREAMSRAYVGGIVEVVRSRLRGGREEEIPRLLETVQALTPFYEPPTQSLRASVRRPVSSESLDSSDRVERLLRALALVVAERGYAEATVGDVVARAGVSNSVFYGSFANKEEAALAAVESGCAQIAAAVLPVFRRSGDWPDGVPAALTAFFNFLAFRPALGHLVMVGANAVGPRALELREAGLRPLFEIFSRATVRAPHAPPVWFEAIAGAVYHLAYTTLKRGEAAELPALAPIAAYLALAPFLGAEVASELAHTGRSDRSPGSEANPAALLSVAQRVLSGFSPRPVGIAEVAAHLDLPEDEVRAHVEDFVEMGIVIPAGRGSDGDRDQELFQTRMGLMGSKDWNHLPRGEREAVSAEIHELIEGDVAISMQSGMFDRRLDRALLRTPLIVDEEGWDELSRLHGEMMDGVLEVQDRSARRLEESTGRRLSVRNVSYLFEMPAED
jgi:AcrR family transcriptional regulator